MCLSREYVKGYYSCNSESLKSYLESYHLLNELREEFMIAYINYYKDKLKAKNFSVNSGATTLCSPL